VAGGVGLMGVYALMPPRYDGSRLVGFCLSRVLDPNLRGGSSNLDPTTVVVVGVKVVTLVDRVDAAGGGERFAWHVATGLDPQRFESILCVSRPTAPEPLAAARAAGVRVLELGRRSRGSLAPWLRLAHVLRRDRVDILHSHKFGSNAWASLVAGPGRVPVFIAHEHSWSFAGDATRAALDRYLVARRATAIVAVSELDRQRIVERCRIDSSRVILQPNGVSVDRHAVPGRLREELGCDAATPIVGIVARLTPEKRVDLFLEAIARLRSEATTVRGVVIGGGPNEPQLRLQVRMLGLDADVTFLGERSDAVGLARDFDVAVLCSDREGCPLALLEYMALGRPIVATRVGGVPEAARHMQEALLVERGDAAALAAAITRVLAAPELAKTLGAAAARRQSTEFDLGAVVRRIERLYENLLGSRIGSTVKPAAASPVRATTAHGGR
jgi:glycosyltransferase involved in cell wall biosynthesis